MALIALAAIVGGCASTGPQSTRLTTDDFIATSSDMAAQLRGSDFLRERTPDSPRIVIAIRSVENLTSDLMSGGEKWTLMNRVRNSVAVRDVCREKNIAFVIPAEKLESGREKGTLEPDAAAGRAPTHVMSAIFTSIRRAAKNQRADVYSCQYQITDLATGQLAWSGVFEFQRQAAGRAYD